MATNFRQKLELLDADARLGQTLVALGESAVKSGEPLLGNTYCLAGNMIVRAVKLRKAEMEVCLYN